MRQDIPHPSEWTATEFRAFLNDVINEQRALAHRKNTEYGQSYARYGDFLAVVEVLRVADRIREQLKKYTVMGTGPEHEAVVMGYDPAMFRDAKFLDQLRDIANYAMYSQFFFDLPEGLDPAE